MLLQMLSRLAKNTWQMPIRSKLVFFFIESPFLHISSQELMRLMPNVLDLVVPLSAHLVSDYFVPCADSLWCLWYLSDKSMSSNINEMNSMYILIYSTWYTMRSRQSSKVKKPIAGSKIFQRLRMGNMFRKARRWMILNRLMHDRVSRRM